MKVLLLGDFSSYHRYLKEGLLELGHDVKLFANGDGWKKIGGADGTLYTVNHKGWKKYYGLYMEPYQIAKQFSGYDVVQLVSTGVYSPIINANLINRIASKNKCLSLSAVGVSYALHQAYCQGKFDYFTHDNNPNAIKRYAADTLRGRAYIRSDQGVVDRADIIIPGLYEYAVGYAENSKLHEVIPFPVNVRSIEYRENRVRDKIVFFHGLNQEVAKGTSLIRAALERLQETYPDDVEVVMDGHMPFDEYVKVMQRTNVVIDQCRSYGYGINACIAMAQGKVVLSGNRKETLDAMNLKSTPMLHIQPDVEQIYGQLVWLVENRQKIGEIGYQSRQYVETVHNHVKVAQQYVDAWQSTGKI